MKITTRVEEINANAKLLNVSADVSKNTLSYYTEIGEEAGEVRQIEDEGKNSNQAVGDKLSAFEALAHGNGYAGLRVVCEPTGGFERRLLRLARQGGHQTAYVSAEAMNKLQVVQSNDRNKSDQKDPRTIHLLAKLGKTLTHRNLSGPWQLLRQHNVHYERLDAALVEAKNRAHRLLLELFCDLSFKKDFRFGPSGYKVLKAYGFNPYRMVQVGAGNVRRKLGAMKMRANTIERLYRDARRSALQQLDSAFIAALEEELREVYKDIERCARRKEKLRAQMLALLQQIITSGQIRLRPLKGAIHAFALVRILAETGPLADFKHYGQLERYAGLNLVGKQSGTYRGREHIGKKGRTLLRKGLNQAIVTHVRKHALFGPYYHRKKKEGMVGTKAMTAVARKYLKMLWALEKSGARFEQQRLFTCLSQYLKQAA
jgi:transposase